MRSAEIEDIKDSISSPDRCSQDTVDDLRSLLGLDGDTKHTPEAVVLSKATSTASTRAKPSTSGRTPASKRPTKVTAAAAKRATPTAICEDRANTLTGHAKHALGTHVINAGLKRLADACAEPIQDVSKESKIRGEARCNKSTSQARATGKRGPAGRQGLSERSSNERNGVPGKQTSNSEEHDALSRHANLRAVARCCSIAFQALRSVSGEQQSQGKYKLEIAVLALVSRSITLGLYEEASHELSLLHDRIQSYRSSSLPDQRSKLSSSRMNPPCRENESQPLVELLSVGLDVTASVDMLELLMDYHIQVLRLLAAQPQSAVMSAALNDLDPELAHSPTQVARRCQAIPDLANRASKNAENLTRLLLLLSSKAALLASAKSVHETGSMLRLRLQTMALQTRLYCAETDSLRTKVEAGIWSSLNTCLEQYARSVESHPRRWAVACMACEALRRTLECLDSNASEVSPATCRLLAELALEQGATADALAWGHRFVDSSEHQKSSKLVQCAWTCRTAALSIQLYPASTVEESIQDALQTALERLNGSLSGSLSEFKTAVQEAARLRKAVIALIRGREKTSDKLDHSTETIETTAHTFLCSFVRFLGKYLGSSPASGSEAKLFEAFESRRGEVSDLTKAAVESVLFSLKRHQRLEPCDHQRLSRSLDDCSTLLRRLVASRRQECKAMVEEAECHERLLVLISDTYWSCYASDTRGKDSLKLLEGACETLLSLSGRAKRMARLPLKEYKRGRVLQASGDLIRAFDAFHSSLQAMIDGGYLDKGASPTNRSDHQDLDDRRLFRNTLKAEIDLRLGPASLKSNAISTEWFDYLDDARRAALVEAQLEIILERSAATLAWAKEGIRQGNCLLRIYEQTRYPIRHRRALVILLGAAWHPDTAVEQSELVEHAKTLIDLRQVQGLADDEGLAGHADHIIASLCACVGLRSFESAEKDFEVALTTWERLVAESDTTSILCSVDNIDGWMSQLEAIAEYADLRGLNKMRLRALCVKDTAQRAQDGEHSRSVMGSHLAVASQLQRMGYLAKAGLYLARVGGMKDLEYGDPLLNMQYQTTMLEYSLARQDIATSEACLTRLEDLQQKMISTATKTSSADHVSILLADMFQISARVLHENGKAFNALLLAKKALSLLQHLWKSLNKQILGQSISLSKPDSKQDVDALADKVSVMAIARPVDETQTQAEPRRNGPAYWKLGAKLFRSMLLVSRLSKYYGLHQDAIYAAEQAHKLAIASAAERLTAEALVEVADATARAEQADISSEHFKGASAIYDELSPCKGRALHYRSLGHHNHIQGQFSAEMTAYDDGMNVLECIAPLNLAAGMEQMAVPIDKSRKQAKDTLPEASRAVQSTKNAVKTKIARRILAQEPLSSAPTSTFDTTTAQLDCEDLCEVNHDIMRRKADALLAQGKPEEAAHHLETVKGFKGNREYQSLYKASLAAQSLRQAMTIMAKDTVLSMLAESTICHPSIAHNSEQRACSRGSISTSSPAKRQKLKTQSSSKRSNQPSIIGVPQVDRLASSLSATSEVILRQLQMFSSVTTSRLCSSAVSSSLILSMVKPDLNQRGSSAISVADTVEISRDLAAYREQVMTQVNNIVSQDTGILTSASMISSDMTSKPEDLQPDLCDILPGSWLVVSLTLADDRNYLYVNQYRANKYPTVLRIPIAKQSAYEDVEESLTFQEAKSELYHIIQGSDETIQQGKDGKIDMQVKSAKSQWWAEREALDGRLKDLLVNMENMWFGGFRGILADHVVSLSLLAVFKQSFLVILEKHLPSRQSQHKKGGADQADLSSNVLELFVGLGPPSSHDNDMEESLTDLLYFVMDILQFNGEQNAYDEIDFDAIILETQDALQAYHDAVHRSNEDCKVSHTILVLDKQLHAFPWESMPRLSGRSVSRLPSLVDLRDRLRLMQQQQSHRPGTDADGIYVSQTNGTYILNPSSDLPKTQTRFSAPLSALTKTLSWTSVVGRAPSQTEFGTALALPPAQSAPSIESHGTTPKPAEDQRILLYLGHGSGGHYIRPKRIKRLHGTGPNADTGTSTAGCATTLLFGCSSVALTTNGEFEPTGVPKTYLLAGAPAVLGALWDTTDGDLDCFTAGVLGRWGLVDKQSLTEVASKSRGGNGGKMRTGRKAAPVEDSTKKEQKTRDEEGQKRMALSEAAAVSREDCYLNYLNGAAMVVYGVPVYLEL